MIRTEQSEPLLRFLADIVGIGAAEDLLQEVLLRYHRSRGAIAREDHGAWLFRVARNAAFDHLRKLRRRRRTFSSWEGEAARKAEVAASIRVQGPDAGAARAEISTRLRAAVEALPEAQREVFVRKQLEGETFKQIAAAMDCPIGTALARYHRALDRLKTDLEDLYA